MKINNGWNYVCLLFSKMKKIMYLIKNYVKKFVHNGITSLISHKKKGCKHWFFKKILVARTHVVWKHDSRFDATLIINIFLKFCGIDHTTDVICHIVGLDHQSSHLKTNWYPIIEVKAFYDIRIILYLSIF